MTRISILEQSPVAHRPAIAPHQQYVQWTQHHQYQAAGLPPCAQYLWQYLLYKYPGGVPQEIDLAEIRFEISQGRSKIYCVQSLKNALWKYLVPRGLVAVVKEFTKRILRVVALHAGPIKAIENKFGKPQKDLRSNKIICKNEPETIVIADSIQSYSEYTQQSKEPESCADEELEEIRNAITDAPFMQDDLEPESSQSGQLPTSDKFDTAVTPILERLRHLNIPFSNDVRQLVARIPEVQLQRNVSALEEESATKGLKSPIAAFKYFVTHNCQPRLSDRQSWWNRAAVALGREQRDLLIQAVFEYAGEEVVLFTSGQRLPLAQAQLMSWEAIAALGEST